MNVFSSRRQPAVFKTVAIALVLLAGIAMLVFSPSHQAGAADRFPLYGDVTVDTDALNLRATPGLDGPVNAILPFGTVLAVEAGPTTADGYDWHQITRLDVTREGESGADGWVAGESLAPYGYAPGTELQVTDGPVNLRDGASVTTVRLTSLPQGTRMTVITGPLPGGGYSWYQVMVENGDKGWVTGEFLGLANADETTFKAGDGVRVSDGPVNFREAPGLDGKVLSVVPEGALFAASGNHVDADGYTWISVFDNGYGHGWIATAFLSLDPNGYPSEDGH